MESDRGDRNTHICAVRHSVTYHESPRQLWDTPPMAPLIILGCGYVGSRLARAALAAGRTVRVCARSTGRMAPLAELGAEVKYLDAAIPKQLRRRAERAAPVRPSSTRSRRSPRCRPGRRSARRCRRRTARAQRASSTSARAGLYGSQPDDETWIDEDTPIAHDDPPMKNVQTDEHEVERLPVRPAAHA